MPGQPWRVGDEAYRRVGGTGYDFIMKNVGAWASGWFNGEIDGVRSPAPFTLCGLQPGQKVDLHASAGWDGNYAGACIVFGDSGSAGVQAQTVGNPGANPSLDNFTFIGTATADARGEVSGAMKRGNTRSNKEGQSNGFWFVIHPVPSPHGGYTQWIASHAPDSPGIARDADGDGKSNGLEYILGTDPAAADAGGLLAGEMTASPDGSSFTFTHPLSESVSQSLSEDPLMPYVWSTDLETFHANGASDGHCTVEITCQNNSGTATATATVTGGETPGRLFLRLDANSGWFDQVRGIDGSSDFDGDGLDNALERSIGSNPLLPDTSGDGMPDGWKHRHGLDVLASNPLGNADADSLPDLLEYLRGSDPREADENGDGRPDGAPVPGQVAMEQWTIPYARFSDITYIENGPPEAVAWLDSLSHDAGMVDNSHPFGRRIRGYLTPPASGEYRFWVYGDDYAEFWLSADASTARIQRIAFNHWWNFREDYQQYPGQSSFPRQLEAGENYYFEIFHQGDETNDYFGVAWQHGSMPEPEIIGSQAIRSFVYDPADLDGDTLDDAFEKTAGLDPLDGPPFDGRFDDPDADTFENAWEARNGLNPLQANPYPARSRADLFPGLDDPGARSLEGWYRKTEGRHHQTEAFSHNTAVYLAASGTHADEYLFAYRSARQPFRLTAKVAYTAMDDTRAGAGLLVRGTLNEVAPAYRLSLAPDGRVQSRTKLQGDTPVQTKENGLLTFETAIWLRLEWDGRHITAHYSDDGQRWIEHEQRAIDLGDYFHFGFALTSHDPLEVVAAAFTDYRIDYDSDNDGLWNSEEAALGTRADAADTDLDGTSDYEEAFVYLSDPNVNDIGSEEPLDLLDLTAGSGLAGEWTQAGGGVHSHSAGGTYRQPFTLAADGLYTLSIHAAPFQYSGDLSEYEVAITVDGQFVENVTFSMLAGESETKALVLPWLEAGGHHVDVRFINFKQDRNLLLRSIGLSRRGGPDADGNGKADWIDHRLGLLNGIEAASTASNTSPFCLEGRSRYVSMLSGDAADARPMPADRWYVDIDLDPGEATVAAVGFENGGLLQEVELVWQETNLIPANGDSLRIRKGDSLLLNVAPAGETAGATRIVVAGSAPVPSTADAPVPVLFDTEGTYVVDGSWSHEGASASGRITVEVIEASFAPSPVGMVDQLRSWANPDLPQGLVLESDMRMQVANSASTETGEGGHSLDITTDARQPRHIAARLGEDGPVLHSQAIRGLRAAKTSATSYRLVERYEDDTALYEVAVVLTDLYPEVEVHVDIFVGGVLFDDGSSYKVLTAEDFNELGVAYVRFIRPGSAKTSICHRTLIYESDVWIGEPGG